MNWRKWLDECGLAARGIVMATREKRFWAGFVPTFIIFAWLINMLSSGLTKFQLLFSGPFPESLQIIPAAFGETFNFAQDPGGHFLTLIVCILQSVLIGLIVLLWHKKRQQNSTSLEQSGIITGLIALGAGCPTCGTTLLMPLITPIFTTIFSVTDGLAIAGTVTSIVAVAGTWLAIIIALFALKRLGLENYVIIKNELYLARKSKEEREQKQHK